MENYVLKTKSGVAVRKEYQFFEWEAMKLADSSNMSEGTEFSYGNSGELFTVALNNRDYISIYRYKNQKMIEARKVYDNEAEDADIIAETSNENANTLPNNETEKIMNATTTTQPEKANQIEDTLKTLTSLILSQQTATVDMKAVEAMIDEKIKKAQTISVKINEVVKFETKNALHDKFEDVLFWAAQRQPVYLFGPAGTGKNVLSEQVAEALHVPFYYAGCLQQKYELEGFINAAGEYQETEFYRAFTRGGVFLFDEIDGTAAEVLIAFNAALANGYYNFPKYGKTKAHENFIVIAAGNTAGRGASDAYNGRFQLDASTLDRFVFIELDYNRGIEKCSANNDEELVEFAHLMRNIIKQQGLTYTMSTRAIKRMAISVGAGIPIDKALKQSVCGGWDARDVALIRESNEMQKANNKYAKAFRDLYL